MFDIFLSGQYNQVIDGYQTVTIVLSLLILLL